MLKVTDFVPATIYTGLGVIIIVEFNTFGDNVMVFSAISVIFIVIGSEYEPTSNIMGYNKFTSIYRPSYEK